MLWSGFELGRFATQDPVAITHFAGEGIFLRGASPRMTYESHKRDDALLEPYNYIDDVKGKDIRGKLIDAFVRRASRRR